MSPFAKILYFSVYILRSPVQDLHNVGQTNDIIKRLKRHNKKEVAFTKSNTTWELVCLVIKASRAEAIKLEKYLKILSRNRKEEFIKKYSIKKN